METLLIARHGESVASQKGVANGDPDRDRGLTDAGRQQARGLGAVLVAAPIEMCVTSVFPRTEETAALALEGRDIPHLATPELNDIRYGKFEGGPKAKPHAWMTKHAMDQPIPSGESRVGVARRACAGLEAVLERPERLALVVTHELIISDLLFAVARENPPNLRMQIPYATPYRFSAEAAKRAVEYLHRWAKGFDR